MTDTVAIGRFMLARRAGADWIVSTSKTDIQLGLIEWYAPWRKFVFCPEPDAVFDTVCLADLADFLKTLPRPAEAT